MINSNELGFFPAGYMILIIYNIEDTFLRDFYIVGYTHTLHIFGFNFGSFCVFGFVRDTRDKSIG